MGAKTWMLVHADGDPRAALKAAPRLDREATARLAQRLFAGEALKPLADGDLFWANPDPHELCIGSFPGLWVVAAREFRIAKPSTVARRFLDAGGSGTTTLVYMYSVVDFFAYARWQAGTLVRSLSLGPDFGIVETIGEAMAFEAPFWSGRHPAVDEDEEDDYPLPFHPLELGEAALLDLFGYQIEGTPSLYTVRPEDIALMTFERPEAG